ncbi:DUF1707 and DUF4190 domain-containing protein [Streptomyces bryophytorum]|nr:DUF1707 and DUF4190 domain-containing protein [Actinacidiphila bryophytorum]MBM9436647.1 DUF1707 and DUF4190 domain-containing protein [Actinacidiphila bryophytorum]MBN6543775.1 DUF1707 and DUF4190 domain-containing protein [Actinacidiphila bryophytorum]
MLAGDADRERAVNVLKDAFTEGRLTQPEYEDRVGRAYQSRTYGELDQVTADIPPRVVPPAFLPAAPPYMPMPMPAVPETNGQAIGSLVCGICAPFTGGLSAIPAVVLGHMARNRIRYTGQQGEGMAVAGLVLGYLTLAGFAALIVLFALFATGP